MCGWCQQVSVDRSPGAPGGTKRLTCPPPRVQISIHMTEDNGRSDSDRTLPVSRRTLALAGVAIFLVVGFWFWRPKWHWLFYSIVYRYPGVIQWLPVGSGLAAGTYWWTARAAGGETESDGGRRSRGYSRPGFTARLWQRATTHMGRKQKAVFVLGILIAAGGLVVGPVAGTVYANVDMANQVEEDVTHVDSLPDTDSANPRVLPKEVADEYAENSFQYQRHKLAGGDITYINGTPHWTYGIEPEGINSYVINQEGAVYVDMTTDDSDVSVQETEFKRGQGMAVWRNHRWQVAKSDYWIEQQDTMVVPTEEGQYLVTPYREHDLKFRFAPLPQVYSVPEYGDEKDGLLHRAAVFLGLADEGEQYGGVKVVHPDGTIENIEPDEASDHPIVQNQRVYPYEQTRFEVESMAYKHGAVNKWFFHDEQLEVRDAPGDDNEQPFTVTTTDGIKYIVAAEPAESGSGVYQIWVADAQTGELEMLELDEPETGAAAATEYVMTAIDRSGLYPVEPIPVVVDDQLYWQVKVLPEDGRGIKATAFVNADSTDVTMVESDDDIRAFLAGSNVDEASLNESDSEGGETTEDSGESSSTLVITIEHEDGSTEQITVEEGATVTIENRDDE